MFAFEPSVFAVRRDQPTQITFWNLQPDDEHDFMLTGGSFVCSSTLFAGSSPLGHGFLTGAIRSNDDLSDDDWRKTNPRFTGENLQRNLRIVDEVKAVASEAGATPAQVALAWLLAQGDDIAPIPGTKRVARVEENIAADKLELSPAQMQRLNNLTPAAGERHDAGNMAVIER